ncbi:GTPase Obg [Frankliniella fusca]|uniref:GTPase Obg n=1 Tax=Frankliniella fusca TaxID=407009 RepID=A0AAE1I5P6_9NEOP|nr:GTPase Obg [Frankliniella fusca]
MTLSSQLEATAPPRVRKSVTVVPPEHHHHGHHGGGGGLRHTLQSLFRSTGNLSSSVASVVDETAATFVRTLSYRRRKKKSSSSRSSQWTSYASMSIDEETASSDRRDGSVGDDDDGGGLSSDGGGSTLSLADDASSSPFYRAPGVPGAPRPLRRTLSFVEPGTVGADGPGVVLVGGVAVPMRPGGAGGGRHGEYRRSVGSLPLEYTALAAHGRRHSRSREHMHSAWSTSLTSLQEDEIADIVAMRGSVASLGDGVVRRSYDSVFMMSADADGRRNGVVDEVSE